jgi:transposase
MLLADRGYDADWIRALASKRGVWANIPPRCNRNEPICFSPYLYRARLHAPKAVVSSAVRRRSAYEAMFRLSVVISMRQ